MVCPPFYIYHALKCQSTFDEVPNVVYEVYYKASIYRNNESCEMQDCFQIFANDFEFILDKAIFSRLKSKHTGYYVLPNTTVLVPTHMSNYTYFIIDILFEEYGRHVQELYLNVFMSVTEIGTPYYEQNISIRTKMISKMALESENSTPFVRFHRHGDRFDRVDTVHVNRDYYCPRIKFNTDEVNISKTQVIVSSLNVTYDINSEIRNGNHVLVCLDSYMDAIHRQKTNNTTGQEDMVEEILSFICSTISIVSLICTLVVYTVFKELRTIPGINNMILSGHLIIANVLYVFGFTATEHCYFCVAIGMLIHYFWMTSIMWMHICSIHMFRVFFFMMTVPNVSQSKRVIAVYSLYVNVVSVLLISVNIISFVIGDESADGYLGYGGEMCYIANSKMVLFTFVIPVGIILLSNIVLFCLVVVRIEKLPEVKSTGGKNRNTFLIYIKLTCLTGVTWIFGFIYQWTLIRELSYIFIICNASQGLFIFLSFCCSARVRNMCCLKLKQIQYLKKSSAKSTSGVSSPTKTVLVVRNSSENKSRD